MPKLIDVYRRLQPAKNINKLTIFSQSTNDIINQVLGQHEKNKIEAKKICNLFEAGNIYETSKNIWNFLKYQVPYKVEKSDQQTTKTISRMLHDAINGKGNDCKHYAGFTGAILDACGYTNWKYRFAGYSKYLKVPTHTYVVANDEDGMVYVDAVINGFDLEKPYVLKIDKKINKKDMSLYKLSGVDVIGADDGEIGGLFDKLRQGAKNLAKFAGSKLKAIKDLGGKILDGAKTMGLAIPRNAFILLIRFNVKGWATGLKNKTFNDLGWWVNDFGGNRTDLMNAIKDGSKKARIFGIDEYGIGGDLELDPQAVGGIGEPVTITAALASAAPIISKVVDYLDKAQKVAAAADKIKTKIEPVIKTLEKANAAFEKITGKKVTDIIFTKDAGKSGSKNSISPDDVSTPTEKQAEQVAAALLKPKIDTKIDTKTMLLIGGGAAAILLLYTLNKKK